MKKYIYKTGLVTLFSTLVLSASATTITTQADLAKQQEVLSQKIVTAYAQHKDISQVINRLEMQQNRLKDSIHDPEISNLLDFLQLCLRNIKTLNTQPHSAQNTQAVADLSTSIREGSRYIARSLR